MAEQPPDGSSIWSSWLLVLLILILVAIALADGVPRLPVFLRSIGIF